MESATYDGFSATQEAPQQVITIDNKLSQHQDVRQMERISHSLGTNPGGIYKDTQTGEQLYIKVYRDPAQASCEFIANKIFQRIGAPVLDGMLVRNGESVAYATPYHPDFTKLPKSKQKEARKYFVAAAYLLDSDMVGTGPENPYGNLQQDKDGNFVFVDHGAALLFWGLAGRREPEELVADDIPELESMRSWDNIKSMMVFIGISDEDIKKQAGEIVEKVTPEYINAAIEASKLGQKDTEQVRNLLFNRREVLKRLSA